MKYSTASIQAAHVDGGPVHTVDLEGMDLSALYAELWELFPLNGETCDEMPEHVALTNPEGFAVHLFQRPDQSRNSDHVDPLPSFDDILSAWSDESDDDRREAMGEYLDDMGADDLSDFDEAYQGEYGSGAAFAESLCEELGTVPEDFPSWIAIDWEQTWNGGLRFDYTITNSGYVFRNM